VNGVNRNDAEARVSYRDTTNPSKAQIATQPRQSEQARASYREVEIPKALERRRPVLADATRTPSPGGVMSFRSALTRTAGAAFLVAAIHVDAGAQANMSNSLYKRLGGYDAIAAVTDDFLGRLANEPLIAPFFKGHSQNTVGKLRMLVIEQVCAAAGGPCIYTGRDMKTTHKGLGITEEQWNASVRHFTASLDKFSVPAKEKGELLGIIGSLKNDIVEKPM
jgi:hemoglobin